MRLRQGCGEMSGKIVRLNRSLYGLKASTDIVAQSTHDAHEKSWILSSAPRMLVLCVLTESGSVSIVTVVHVDDICAAGRKDRCDQFCDDSNRLVPLNNLGELRGYAGCRFSRDWEAGRFDDFAAMFRGKHSCKIQCQLE